MQTFTRIVLFLPVLIASVFSPALPAYAQSETRPAPGIASQINPELAGQLKDRCYDNVTTQVPGRAGQEVVSLSCGDWDDSGGTNKEDERIVDPQTGIRVQCTRTAGEGEDGATCKYTASDGSYVTVTPNFAWGNRDAYYYADGELYRESNTGIGQTDDSTAGLYGDSNCGNDVACHVRRLPGYLFVALGFVFLALSGLLLFLAGTVFNWVVLRTVFQFGEYFGTSDGMLLAWSVMRDIANIGLLFGFIFLGVLLILNVEGGGHGHGGGMSARKAIPRLLIFAVLLNFSLFTTQFIVDVANAFGSTFTVLAGSENCSINEPEGGARSESLEDCAVNTGISSKIIQAAGIVDIFDGGRNDFQQIFENVGSRPYQYAVSLVMLSVFVLVTAMVLFAGAIMLIIRVVVLSLLMVTSPVGFAGMVLPGLSGIAQQWWDTLIKQSFFAPVYLLMVFISIKLTEGLMGDSANLTNAIMAGSDSGAAGNVQVVMVYLIVIGFMIASLLVAQKFGAVGAGFASKSAGALTLGTVGFVGRRTAGRASTRIANNIRSSPLGETELGRRLAGVADYGSKASFSLRNVVTSKNGMGLDVGKANKAAGHGYHGVEEKLVKERVEYAKSLKGDRGETDTEMAARIASEEEAINQKRRAAQESLDTATSEQSTAQAARDTQKQIRDNIAYQLAEQRAQVAANPGDAAKQQALRALEEQLEKETRELSAADQRLASANDALAKATTERADALKAKANEERQSVSEKQRRTNYAQELDSHMKLGPDGKPIKDPASAPKSTLNIWPSQNPLHYGGHVNHEAASQIIRDAGKSKTEKALEAIKEQMEKGEKGDGGGADHAAPSKGGGKAAKGDSHAH